MGLIRCHQWFHRLCVQISEWWLPASHDDHDEGDDPEDHEEGPEHEQRYPLLNKRISPDWTLFDPVPVGTLVAYSQGTFDWLC